ncbi:MAG: carboxymuconolactone decarboxylase family protein [Actinomycetota bacterium]
MAVPSFAHTTWEVQMPDDERYQRGREKLREVHGDRSLATVEALGDLGRLIVEVAYGDVYSRPGLTLRERQIASVAALVATGRSSQLPVHLRSSLNAGLSADELREVIIQTATIAGFPPAMNAMSTLKTIVGEDQGR